MYCDPDDFDRLVDHALASIPESLTNKIENCVILVEDMAPGRPWLLGLYVGIPLTERTSNYSAVLPDRIYIYRQPILMRCNTPWEVVEQVRMTVVHEIAHHFGISDERLDELGYG